MTIEEFIAAAELYVKRGYDDEHVYGDGIEVHFSTLIKAAHENNFFVFDPAERDGQLGRIIFPNTGVATNLGWNNIDAYVKGAERPAMLLLRELVGQMVLEARARVQLGLS